jgi:drug/metabolite transporter (DMT)-like permease
MEADVIRTIRPPPGLLWGAVGVLAFSVSLPATRVATLGGLDATIIGAGRGVFAALLAAAYLLWRRASLPDRSDLPSLALVGLGVVFGFPVLTSLALAERPAAQGIVVAALLPASTAVMAVLRAGERPSAGFWAASTAGVAVVLAFALGQGATLALERPEALLLAAVALCGLGYAEGGALARRMDGPLVISWALLLMLPASLVMMAAAWDGPRLAAATPAAWGAFAYLSAVSMFLGFFAWYRGLALGGVARVGQLQLAQPLLSLGWAALALGEGVTPGMLATALLVLVCVVLTQRLR